MRDLKFRPVDKSKYSSVKSSLSSHVFALGSNETNSKKSDADAKRVSTDARKCYGGCFVYDSPASRAEHTSAGPNTELNVSTERRR